ncbi:hypothetical protein [Erythrobacter sp. THAF29]|uniref:hypothetical protein n=1 Tax=Erythrobacter sp. THAF29 TaxID=2587851 RepID=UPI0012683D78|nr:hypothetical protein [Erythrobacter sp. THAF29]QFT75966.1 hypothetical protein FIU90_00285 [Erythrobacter sp. THAF29]
MDAPELTWLSVVAASLYLAVAGACTFAANTASRYRQPPLYVRSWMLIALFFAVLVSLRLFLIEDLLEFRLRELAHEQGFYNERRVGQISIMIGLFALASLAAIVMVRKALRLSRGRRDQALFAAKVACSTMVLLICLRLVSLHVIDALLYGPLKLNWLIDIGTSLAVLGCALVYIRLVRASPKAT